MTNARRRWSFRARLTATIAAVFITGGIALLSVQYLLVQGLFNTALDGITACIDSSNGGVTVVTGNGTPEEECRAILSATQQAENPPLTTDPRVVVEQTAILSQEVLSGLVLWSIVTLLVFTAVAVLAASWLSRRSFARIGQITDTTKHITRDDLHQRLDLPGPADEIKELGDAIDAMLDGLEASFTRQERFITNASHELRTPLTTTRTALEIPLEQGRVPEDLEPAIRRALDANQRSEQLIAALLQLARTTTPVPFADNREPIDLAQIAEQSVARHQEDIDAAHLTVTTDLAESMTPSADLTLVTLAIDNLIANAVHHNNTEGTLHITTDSDEHSAWIDIANSGAVLSDEETARLTEPFNRGANTRILLKERNLGLGLTLVQNIAEASDATLALTPRPDGGLTARISFRVQKPDTTSY